jgi:hypothetical protein
MSDNMERKIKNLKNETKTSYTNPKDGKFDKAIERADHTLNRRNEGTR